MSYTFQQIHPALARGKFKPEMYLDPEWWAEEKLDGDRRVGQFLPDGVRLTGRRVSDVDGLLVEKTDRLPHLAYEGNWKNLLGTVLDGEVIFPGGRSKDVTSIIGSKPELAIQKQEERGWLQWMVFDCLWFKGNDIRHLPFRSRREMVKFALEEWNNPHAKAVPLIRKNKENYVLSIWGAGGEGVVFKHHNSSYGDDKAWVKVKREFTEDVVIMGYDEPKPESLKVSGDLSVTKYKAKGWIGAVRFGQYKNGELVYCGSCSGMTDEIRQQLSESRDDHIGMVVEVLANEREPTGRFRHPRWVRFREDKNPTDCLYGVG